MNAPSSVLRLTLGTAVLIATGCSSKGGTSTSADAHATQTRKSAMGDEVTSPKRADAKTPASACTGLAAETPRTVSVAFVLATRCPSSVQLSPRDVHGLTLRARTPQRARNLLLEARRWGDNESSRLVSLLLATETFMPTQAGETMQPVPVAGEIAVIPMTSTDVELARRLYALTNDATADDAQKTSAHAALATIFLQVFDSLGVRDAHPLPPLARHVAAVFLRHGRAFSIAHLRDRVPGLHPFLLRLEPEMLAVVGLLAQNPMGAADGPLASGWLSGYRYLRIGEVRTRLGKSSSLPWRVGVQRFLELRMPRQARALLAREFPAAARSGVLDDWLEHVEDTEPLAPSLPVLAGVTQPTRSPLGAGEQPSLPSALAAFQTQRENDRRAEAETIETALIHGARGVDFDAAIAWADHEASLLDDPDLLRIIVQRAATTPALRLYRPVLIAAARRVSLRPELYRYAADALRPKAHASR